MLFEKKHCVKFNKYVAGRAKKKFSFFAGLILALLPKCPFCFMAFSSTFVLCDQAGTFTDTHTHSSSTTFLLSSLFCGITFAGILFNYHDNRTKYALMLALAGSACIVFSVAMGGGLALYYCGVSFILFGVWLNGRFLFFVRKIRKYFFKDIRNPIIELQ
jgi:hypothetical protein